MRSASALLLLALPFDGGRVSPSRTASPCERVERPTTRWTLAEILAAVRAVESGGSADEGRWAVGDEGDALGPYQIHRAYWEDAAIAGDHGDCRDSAYAQRVVLAYWKRYCPQALAARDAEVLARVHNGGPAGATKAATVPFWRKVERQLPIVTATQETKP